MPVDGDALWEAFLLLSKEEEIINTAECTTVAVIVTTGAAVVGSLAGPAGRFLGTTISGLALSKYYENKFKPVFEILKNDLSSEQQQKLKELLDSAFKNVGIEDIIGWCAFIANPDKTQFAKILLKQIMNCIAETSRKPVNIELRSKNNLRDYEKKVEDYKRSEGLTGHVYPPINGGTEPIRLDEEFKAFAAALSSTSDSSSASDLPKQQSDILPSSSDAPRQSTLRKFLKATS